MRTQASKTPVLAARLLGLWIFGFAHPANGAGGNASESVDDGTAVAEHTTYDLIPLPPAAQTAPPVVDALPRVKIADPVIVTATKRVADIRDIPLSIEAFSGEDLRRIGADNLEAIARFSPGVVALPGFDAESAQVIFRGVATDTFRNFFPRSFGLLYEDVSLVNPAVFGPQPNLDPFDMNVEILKGPQGTLFGGSAVRRFGGSAVRRFGAGRCDSFRAEPAGFRCALRQLRRGRRHACEKRRAVASF
ncbi:MAG: TonB-dependent receptor plug domain-containing protein [Panacagrimonas sp.]